MPDTLLTTKFFIPSPRKGQVPRPRLLKLLNNSLDQAVTILAAPPGFGKTTLLAEWMGALQGSAADFPVCCAWVSLDGEDNLLSRFWTYVVASLERAILPIEAASAAAPDSTFSEIRGLLGSSPPPVQVSLTILINRLSRVPHPVLLVLDDFHTILDAAVADSLAFLIDHSPPDLHLVIASRTDPPLPLGRWRARGQVNSLRLQDLRFTRDEAAEFLTVSMGLPLSQENVAKLDQRTEGWAAGLQMAAVALQDQDASGLERAIAAFSGRHHVLLDYFTDEVLHRQPRPIQHFLLQTSVLERFCAELCDAVVESREWRLESSGSMNPLLRSGESGDHSPLSTLHSRGILDHLDRANLFLIPLDDERRWYRYHHLFADLLRARLREAVGPEGEAVLRRRAAAWHSQAGNLAEAVSLALQARDFEQAASLIESPAQSVRIWESGEVATILKWTQQLPPELTRMHLWLRLYQSRSLFYTGQADAAEEILDEIEQAIYDNRVQVSRRDLLLGMVLSHKARYASLRDQAESARELARQALEVLPPAEAGARSFVYPTLALCAYRLGDAQEASRLFEETAQTTRRLGSRFQTMGNLTNLGLTRLSLGTLNEVIRITRQAIQEGTVQGIRLPESGWLAYPLAEALYEQNRLVEAEQTLVDGLKRIEEGNLTDYFGQMPALLARIRLALGRVDEARSGMEAALATARRTTVTFYISEIEAYQARLWVQMGEIQRALAWAEAFQGQPTPERLCEMEQIALGEVLQAAGQPAQARDVLLPLAEDARRRGRHGREIQARLILALCGQDLGYHPAALGELERALLLGEPEGYVRPFLNLGEPLRRLIANWRSQAPAPGDGRVESARQALFRYAGRLASAFPGRPERDAHRTTPLQVSLPEPLTPRELEVLELLCQGRSNKEIADHFVISMPTVKKHIGNIFGKLGVTSRAQAIVRAHELGLG